MKKIFAIVILLFAFSSIAFADVVNDPLTIKAVTSAGEQKYSLSLQIVIFMTLLTLLPAALMMMTSFTRVMIVLAILRQAIGLGQTPTNQLLIGVSLFLTLFIMQPVIEKIYTESYVPYEQSNISFDEAVKRAEQPLKLFMIKQIRQNDLSLFVKMAKIQKQVSAINYPMTVIVPAFVTSELKTSFQIGFSIFLPFLVIDLMVASTLMALGMMMLSPLVISLPFKIMLFVMMDGWNLIIGSLASSFGL